MTPGTAVRKQKKERTQRKILRVAFQRFSESGFSATRTVDIARQAGVAHGTVFVHFPTREALLVRVVEEFGERVARRMHELAREGSGIRAVLEAHLAVLAEYEPFYANLVAERPRLPARVRDTMVGIQSAVSFHLFEAAEREMRAGTIKEMPMHLLFNTWIGLVHHYLANRDLFAPGDSVLRRHGRELVDHFVSLISVEKGGTKR